MGGDWQKKKKDQISAGEAVNGEKNPKQHPTKEKQAGKNNHTSVSFVLHIHFFKQHCLSQSGFWISHFQQNIHILSRDALNVILLDYCIFLYYAMFSNLSFVENFHFCS